ncbi:MAG: family 10 glycosylhydrolase [Bacteroidales bacterium]|nr:family 10 glycosylhydrolase [Bacteroidales bacterium]
MMKRVLFSVFFLFIALNFFAQSPKFKGVWVATVKMLDFPSRRGLSSYELKNELLDILDSCKSIGANAVIFQVRPAADAFYNSPYEPWSEWLTGKQGRAAYPYFDPMTFLIDESHKRGLEFHAWINPFRAAATYSSADLVNNHISKVHPEWCFNYGANKYFDPGIPEVQDYIIKIIADIVTRYDVDGIHFDDYFYPYPLKNQINQIIPIPDYNTFAINNRGFYNIDDWRRDNINRFVQRTHDTIKKINSDVVFGISPCGVWRNFGYDDDGSYTTGLAAYDWIYADGLTWLKNNWIDYIAPQLYWYIGHTAANFDVLVDWWSKHSFGVDLYIGLNIYNVDPTRTDPNWGDPSQIPRQIKLAQSYPQVTGFILYRYKTLIKNPLGLNDSLRNNYFADTAILIAKNNILVRDTQVITWLNIDTNKVVFVKKEYPPQKPTNLGKYRIGSEITLMWDCQTELDSIKQFEVFIFEGKNVGNISDDNLFLITENNYVRFDKKQYYRFMTKKYTFVVKTISINGLESSISNPIRIKIR